MIACQIDCSVSDSLRRASSIHLVFLGEIGYDFIVSASVAVTGGNVALRGNTIPVAAPRCDEGSEVSIAFMEGNAMISIPGIQDSLFRVCWNRSGLVEWRHCVVCFSCCMSIKRLEVDCSAWSAILLWDYYHSMAPCDWVAYGDRFDDPEFDVLVKPNFNFFLLV